MAPWYWRDWRASKARAFLLSTKNWLGYVCYRELLDAHWGEEDCALPADDGDLAALSGVSLEEWLSVKELIARWMSATSDGRLRNPRAFREWQKAKGNRTTARKKARKAAKAMWDRKKAPMLQASSEHAPSIRQACPPSPSPSPSPSPNRTEERRTAGGPSANPFVAGHEQELQREALRLTDEIAKLTGEDPADVFAQAAHYDGAKRQKLNPATMSDDRLLATVRDLRASLKAVQNKQAARRVQ